MKFRSYLLFFTLILISTHWVGCSGDRVNENDPAALFQDAEDNIKHDRYQLALDRLRIVKNKFPYSKLAAEAQLRIADVYFLQENYGEAALSYQTFKDLHPKHEKISYAMLRVGKSYEEDTPTNVHRDLTSAQKGIDAYSEYIRAYPNSPETPAAKKSVEKLRTRLAQKELLIANFYYRNDQFDSARGRYQKLIDLYSETEPAKEALTKISKIDGMAK